MMRFYSAFLLLFAAHFTFSQNTTFEGTPVKSATQFTALLDQFHKSEVYRIDSEAIDRFAKSAYGQISFDLQFGDELEIGLNLEPRDLRHPDYFSQTANDEGISFLEKSENIAFHGRVTSPGGGSVALAIDEDFLFGFFKIGDETYFIEPLWYFVPGQSKDLFVLYKERDVKPSGGVCGVEEMHDFKEKNTPDPNEIATQAEMMGCFQIELAVASDFAMFQKYGSVGAVESHNIGILNAVQTNYDDEFNDALLFLIVTQFTVSSAGADPWTNSNDSGILLADFRNWGSSGGFGANFDLGELWTSRPLNGGVIGRAYLSAVCGISKYHLVRDYTTNASFVQKTTAHEIGHNFSATHDPQGSGFIMAQGAFGSSVWSNNSQNQINSFYPNLNCLASCGPTQPPTVNFSVQPSEGCVPLTVTYQDQSSGATSLLWTFPGGIPASSTLPNPTVTYNFPGSYGATLLASNSLGSNSVTQNDIVFVDSEPVAVFNFTLAGLTILFENASTPNATSFLWDFGDNNSSTEESPTHTYTEDGFYDVSLTVTNDCGESTIMINLPAFTVPTAGFVANPTEGCAELEVEFTNGSSTNALNFFWEFDGGNPATSTEENPSVTYDTPGTYSVSLTVSNPAGEDTNTETDFVTIGTVPVPGFNFTVDGSTATFENTTDNSEGIGTVSYEWNFGDMETSTEEDPVHTYTSDGDFEVTLAATNDCGTVEVTQTVTIETVPTAGFSAGATSGCEPFEVTFTNESSENTTAYEWGFPGGDPSSSTEESPTVTYALPGSYDVSLVVSNSSGADTLTFEEYISVAALPVAGFGASANASTISFTNTSTNATAYEWDFGDNTTSTDEDAEHTYSEDGTYTVTLTATNDCGTDVSTQEVMATSLPQAGFSTTQTGGCAPFTVQFANESSENSISFDWDFPGGDPTSSTEENPSVTYDEPGAYTVTLTASNGLGENIVTETDYILVGGAPTASFTSEQELLTVDFTSTSTNLSYSGNLEYEWDFGDMSTSTEENPSHTYSEDGNYEVTLTVTNDCGSDTHVQMMAVVSLPSAGFSADVTEGCEPFEVAFTNESSENATSYEWNFPGGEPTTSTEEEPVVTYNAAGAYSVTLTVFNTAGEDMTSEVDFIVVGAGPTAGFTSEQDLLTVDFTNTSMNPANSGNLEYNWDFGDMNSSIEENPIHTYVEDGTYEVVLTVTNDCGSATFTENVTVASAPTAGFEVQGASGCVPFEVQFVNTSSANAESFEWSFPGGDPTTSTEENPVVIYHSVGVYDVILTVTNSVGEDTFEETGLVTVDDLPTASFTSNVSDNTVSFTNSSTNATSYEWNFGDTNTSTEENPTHTYSEDGAYTVILTATNDCGSMTTEELIVVATQGQAPVAVFTAELREGCAPFQVTFENSSVNATSYEWSFPGGEPSASTEENPTIIYTVPGTYDVGLVATNINGSDSFEELEYVVVGGLPAASFSFDVDMQTVTFTNSSTNAVNSGNATFEWDFGDTNTSNEENPVHTYAEPGEYTVTLTVINDCGISASTTTVVIMANGLSELSEISTFKVFPNPNRGDFVLVLEGQAHPGLEINFTNILGQVLMSRSVDFRSGYLRQEFTFDGLASGTYIIQVKVGGQALHHKVVVK